MDSKNLRGGRGFCNYMIMDPDANELRAWRDSFKSEIVTYDAKVESRRQDVEQEKIERETQKTRAANVLAERQHEICEEFMRMDAPTGILSHLDSEPEAILLTRLIRKYELLPIGERSLLGPMLWVKVQEPLLRYRVDFLLNNEFVIEVDGRAYHGNPRSFQSDRVRDKDLEMAGYRVIRFTAWQVYKDINKILSYVDRVVLANS